MFPFPIKKLGLCCLDCLAFGLCFGLILLPYHNTKLCLFCRTMKQFSSVKEAMKGSFTGRRQSSGSIMHTDGDAKDITLSIPTFCNETEAEEVDISEYTPDDLERLRLEDPFLYYSIPPRKRQLYESASSPMNSPARSNTTLCPSRRSSCPTILQTNNGSGSDGKEQQQQQQQQRRESVKRARRVSAEPHPSVVIKRIMDEMNIHDDSDDSDIDEEDERLIQALANGTFDQEI